jgi:hypothetical protein
VIRAKTQATNLERYGAEESLASPVIREKIVATNQERYGGPAPSCSAEVVERARQTNLERWGVEWTAQHPEVRQKQLDSMIRKYGSHFFASEVGKQTLRDILLDKYGVPFAPQIEGHWKRCVATFQARYGVDHPRQDPVYFQTILDSIRLPGPNRLETRFATLNPELLYVGNGGYWCWLPKLGQHKNVDFISPGPDPEHPKKGVTKVVEVFGNYWHSELFTGKAPFEHEQELVDGFLAIGIACLVVWESEVKRDPGTVRSRVLEFLSSKG